MSPEDEDAVGPGADVDEVATPRRRRRVFRVVVRLVFVVGVLVVAFVVLAAVFEDLDWTQISSSLRSLDDAEVLALGSMWLVWLACQGLQTASLVADLPVRRGIVAFVGPSAISSLVPGPSDLPLRYRMLTSWGLSPADAGLAVAAGGIFSIGIKLLLPVVAAIGLLATGARVDGALRTVVVIALLIGLATVIAGLVLGSQRWTARVGRFLNPIWGATMRLLRRDDPTHLSERLLAAREQAIDALAGRWLIASWGTVLAAVSNLALLILALRFMDVPESALQWSQVFVVFALVQGLTVIPISAGNAGVAEVAYIGLLNAAAGPGYVNQIAAAVILYRLLTWVSLIPVGLATIGIWQAGDRHRRRRAAMLSS